MNIETFIDVAYYVVTAVVFFFALVAANAIGRQRRALLVATRNISTMGKNMRTFNEFLLCNSAFLHAFSKGYGADIELLALLDEESLSPDALRALDAKKSATRDAGRAYEELVAKLKEAKIHTLETLSDLDA